MPVYFKSLRKRYNFLPRFRVGSLLRGLNFDVSVIIFKIPLSYAVLSKTTRPFLLSGCKITMPLFFRKFLKIPCFLRSAAVGRYALVRVRLGFGRQFRDLFSSVLAVLSFLITLRLISQSMLGSQKHRYAPAKLKVAQCLPKVSFFSPTFKHHPARRIGNQETSFEKHYQQTI